MRAACCLLLVLTLGIGCAKKSGPVKTRFSNEFDCPAEEVRVRDLGSGGYRATGCGRAHTYVCVDSPNKFSSKVTCVRED